VGEVVSLEVFRARRGAAAGAPARRPGGSTQVPGPATQVAGPTALARLERSIQRLEASVRRTPGRLSPSVERELLMIVRAVSGGRTREAADRAERLAGLLGHPAASGT
jgi:hypothetical protein